MKEVIKRDGRIVSFDSTKILSAVEKAMKAAGCATLQGAAAVTEAVVKDLETKYPDTPPKIEEIQDVVERELMRLGFDDAAKQYILYRANRTRIREANTRSPRWTPARATSSATTPTSTATPRWAACCRSAQRAPKPTTRLTC